MNGTSEAEKATLDIVNMIAARFGQPVPDSLRREIKTTVQRACTNTADQRCHDHAAWEQNVKSPT